MTSYMAPGNVQYNYAQLEYIWEQAGGSSQASSIAAAIAMAESGGNSTATDLDSNGSTDRGLWQINSVHGTQSTYDVMGNARAAVAISNNGSNWGAWTTYTSGAYAKYMNGSVSPQTTAINGTNAAANQNATDTNVITSIGGDLISPLGSLFGADVTGWVDQFFQSMIGSILDPLFNIIAGVLGMAAGGTIVFLAIVQLARSTETGQKVQGAAIQSGMSAMAPSSTSQTQYTGATGDVTNVTQTRRPAGKIQYGNYSYQYRPSQVKTTTEKIPVKDALRSEAAEFAEMGAVAA